MTGLWSRPLKSLVNVLCADATSFVADQHSKGFAKHGPVEAQGRIAARAKVCICLTSIFRVDDRESSANMTQP